MSAAGVSEEAKGKIDKALLEKEAGNAAFKAGNEQKAIKHYYSVITLLKGLDGKGLPNLGCSPAPNPAPAYRPRDSGIGKERFTEIDPDAEDEEEVAQDASDDEEEEEEENPNAEFYSFAAITKILAQVYVNMAICQAKKGEWAKCLRNAEEALSKDPDNPKALFKKAQALNRLGQRTVAEVLLLKLKITSQDPGVARELEIMRLAEKESTDKSRNAMRGFIDRANPLVPKFQEIKDDETAMSKKEAEGAVKPGSEADTKPNVVSEVVSNVKETVTSLVDV